MRLHQPHSMILIFGLIFLNLIFWNIFIPIFELPSEHLYFTRIHQIAREKKLADLRLVGEGELVYPDTYPVLMTPVINVLQPPQVYNPQTKKFSPALTLVAPKRGTYNRFSHPSLEKTLQWGSLEWSVHLTRFFTSMFSFLSIMVIFKTTQNLFPPDSYLPYATILFIGFHPKFIHRSASMINLPLLLLAFSLFFHIALTRKPNRLTSFLLGCATGLAIVTKITGLNLIIFFLLYLVLFVKPWKSRLVNLLPFAVGVLATSGWNLVRNLMLYRDPLALNQASRLAVDLHSSQVIPLFNSAPNYWFAVVEGTFITWWDGFGWENLITTWPIHYGVAIVWLVSLWGFFRFQHVLRPSQFKRRLMFLVSCLIVFFISFIQVNRQFFTPQGKDFFPILLPISLIFLLGLSHWWSVFKLPQLKFQPLVFAMLFFGLNLVLLFLVVSPRTFGEQNISQAEYYRQLQADPLKRLWRGLTGDR